MSPRSIQHSCRLESNAGSCVCALFGKSHLLYIEEVDSFQLAYFNSSDHAVFVGSCGVAQRDKVIIIVSVRPDIPEHRQTQKQYVNK